MNKLNGFQVANYLAALYEMVGEGVNVKPKELTDAIADICASSFVKEQGEWFYVDDSGTNMTEAETKIQVDVRELDTAYIWKFSGVYAFAKWDLIHQKLIELNQKKAA